MCVYIYKNYCDIFHLKTLTKTTKFSKETINVK